MKRLFTLVFVALLFSVLGAGIKKTLYRDYGIVVFHPDSMVVHRAHTTIWGNLYVLSSDSTDTMSMTPDKIIIDSVIINDYLYSTDDVRFDSTLYFTDGGADTSSIVQDGTNLKFASDNPFAMSRQLTFVEDVDRTGEGTILFANAIPIGMTTPGDCQGMKTEFKYGVAPTLTGGGKVIQGLMLKMTMDQRWKFASANRNADVRAIGVQAELNDSLGGVLSAIYANAYTDIATDKQIIGEHTTGAYGVGMCAIEARTEIKGAGALTVPHIAGLYVLHRRMGTGGVTGDYHAIHIENSQGTGAISGTETAIHFEPNTMAPPGANFDYGIDMEPVAFGTADVRLSSGATIINPHADTFRITEANIDFNGSICDLTVTGKSVFNDTVMLGDSADKIILPKGSAIELFDTTDTDKFEIYDDGTNVQFVSDNPIYLSNDMEMRSAGKIYFRDPDNSHSVYLYGYADSWINCSQNFLVSGHHYINKTLQGEGEYPFNWDGNGWFIDIDNDDALAFISFHNEDSIKVDTTGATGHRLSWTGAGGMEIRDGTGADTSRWYDDGTRTIFTSDNPFTLDNNVWIPGDTLFFTDGGADTNFIVNTGTELQVGGDNDVYITKALYISDLLNGTGETIIRWDGNTWHLDYDDDNALAYIYFHGTTNEAIKVDSAGQKLWWTGAGGIGITDAVGGADSARWYDDGTHTIFTTDNDFVLSDDVTLGDTINTVFLPKGTRLVLADTSGADSVVFHNDGTDFSIVSDNRITLDGDNLWLGVGDSLILSTTTDTFYIYGYDGVMYIAGVGVLALNTTDVRIEGSLYGNTDNQFIQWNGWKWCLDVDGDDSLAIFTWHSTDTLKADTISSQLEWTGSGGIKADVIVTSVCDTVASAATIALGNYNNFVITGTANMDSIDTAGAFPNWGIAYIQFTGIASANGLTDGKNIKLAGNFAHNADDIMVLQRRGDIFYEISRSAN